MARNPFFGRPKRTVPPLDLDDDQMHDFVVEHFGFDPATVSRTAHRYGVIQGGPRRGFLVVYTEDLRVDDHAVAKRNFVDADRMYDPYNEDPHFLAYIFAPLSDAA